MQIGGTGQHGAAPAKRAPVRRGWKKCSTHCCGRHWKKPPGSGAGRRPGTGRRHRPARPGARRPSAFAGLTAPRPARRRPPPGRGRGKAVEKWQREQFPAIARQAKASGGEAPQVGHYCPLQNTGDNFLDTHRHVARSGVRCVSSDTSQASDSAYGAQLWNWELSPDACYSSST